MKIVEKSIFFCIAIAGLIFLLTGCQKSKSAFLAVSKTKVEFAKDGGTIDLSVKTNADKWDVANNGSGWITMSTTSGASGEATLSLTVTTRTMEVRRDTLVFSAGDATPVKVAISQQASDYLYLLSADITNLTFKSDADSANIAITSEALHWSITNTAGWVLLSQSEGSSGNTTVKVKAIKNTGNTSRSATISISAEGAPLVQVNISQKAVIYPDYNTDLIAPDKTGMNSTAAELAAKIRLGWNLGNSLEAIGGEANWGNPKTTKALIDLVKSNGFNAVRIPCSFNQYMANSATAQLQSEWLDRVKEVVQYCIDNDMYVILNIHWDGGWLEKNCTTAKQDENNAKQKAFWEQIATHLRDFDEHLLFASANEPDVSNATQMAVLLSYHQTFIDAVRSTGGRNSYRILVIQGPKTDIETTNSLMTALPADNIADHMMVEIHYYTPWNFCGMTEDAPWGNMFYYWGAGNHSSTDTAHNPTWGEETTVNTNFGLMKTQFVDKGIPVVLGEYSVLRRSSLTGEALKLHLDSRAYFLKYVTQQAKANGILPFYWDNGATGNNGCALFDRTSDTVFDQQALDALIQGALK
ncbi:MAG TPA: cellulase family glycosylhydrolase [Bacteroidales bacterium]|nr:cellulase family glycosylhydrolase [Bacteroidales bacterium]